MVSRYVSIVLTLAFIGCGSGSDQPDSVTRTDSAGIELVVNATHISSLPRRSVDATPVVEIMSGGGADVVLFQVTDIAPMQGGLVAVGVSSSGQVYLFEPDGAPHSSIGRQGSGPGEFQTIGDVLPLGGDSLAVYDPSLRRLTVLGLDGGVGRTRDVSRLLPAGVSSSLHQLPGGFALVGRAGIGRPASAGIHRDSAPAHRLTRAGDSVATYGSFPGLEYSAGEGMFGMLPFGATLFSATRGDRLLIGLADSPELREYGPGGQLVRLVRWPDHNREVTDQRFAQFIEHQLEPLPESQRAQARTALSSMPYAPLEPAYYDLVVSSDGLTWVGDYPGPEALLPQNPGPARDWILVDPTGAVTEVVTTPPGFRLMTVEEDRLWGVQVDEMGVETVRALAF